MPPANDDFANRIVLIGSSGSWSGSDVGGTVETGEPAPFAGTGGVSIWFEWTAPFTGTARWDTYGSRLPSTETLDTVLDVFTGASLGSLSLVGGNDDDAAAFEPNNTVSFGRTSLFEFAATSGTTYLIRIDTYDGQTGDVVVHWAAHVVSIPTITGFTPTSGDVGDSVVVAGTNFVNSPWVSFRYEDSFSAEWVNASSVTVDSDTQITAVVPAGAVTGRLRVVNDDGEGVSADPYTVNGSLGIASFSPDSGVAGDEITVLGSGFSSLVGDLYLIDLSGAYGQGPPTIDSDSQLRFHVSAFVPNGTYRIRLDSASHTVASYDHLTVSGADPSTISDVSPDHAEVGATVTVTGTHLAVTSGVTIEGAAASFTVIDDSHLSVVVPAVTPGSATLTVSAVGSPSAALTVLATTTFDNVFPTFATTSPPLASVDGRVLQGCEFQIGGFGLELVTEVQIGSTTVTDWYHDPTADITGATRIHVKVPDDFPPGEYYNVLIRGSSGTWLDWHSSPSIYAIGSPALTVQASDEATCLMPINVTSGFAGGARTDWNDPSLSSWAQIEGPPGVIAGNKVLFGTVRTDTSDTDVRIEDPGWDNQLDLGVTARQDMGMFGCSVGDTFALSPGTTSFGWWSVVAFVETDFSVQFAVVQFVSAPSTPPVLKSLGTVSGFGGLGSTEGWRLAPVSGHRFVMFHNLLWATVFSVDTTTGAVTVQQVTEISSPGDTVRQVLPLGSDRFLVVRDFDMRIATIASDGTCTFGATLAGGPLAVFSHLPTDGDTSPGAEVWGLTEDPFGNHTYIDVIDTSGSTPTRTTRTLVTAVDGDPGDVGAKAMAAVEGPAGDPILLLVGDFWPGYSAGWVRALDPVTGLLGPRNFVGFGAGADVPHYPWAEFGVASAGHSPLMILAPVYSTEAPYPHRAQLLSDPVPSSWLFVEEWEAQMVTVPCTPYVPPDAVWSIGRGRIS